MKLQASFFFAAAFLSSVLQAAPIQTQSRVAPPQPLNTQDRLTELEERLDEVEFNSGLDKLRFGLDFSVGVADTSFKLNDEKYNAHNKWASELHLNMSADINDYTKFYGRLSMAKNWGQMDNITTSIYKPRDVDAGRDLRNSGASVYISRAYVDFFATPEFVVTLGRQPATEGPGSNLRNNALRQATYPALLINTLGDAAVLSYKPEFLQNYDFVLRAAYGKVYQFDVESAMVRDWSSSSNKADTDLFYAAVESALPLAYGLENNLFIFSYARLNNFSLPFAFQRPQGQNNTSVVVSPNVYNLGTSDIINLHFEAYNLWNLGLNYFASFGFYKGSKAKALPLRMITAQNGVVQSTPSEMMISPFNEESAYSAHIGLRYDFTQAYKIGAEYFYGSRYWYTLSLPSFNDPLNIRQTRGHAFDIYGIAQIDRNQFLRLSYTRIQNTYSNRGLPLGGAASENAVGNTTLILPGKLQGAGSSADNIMLVYNLKF